MAVKYPRASQIDTERSRAWEQQLRNVSLVLSLVRPLNREAAEEIACRPGGATRHLWRNALGNWCRRTVCTRLEDLIIPLVLIFL